MRHFFEREALRIQRGQSGLVGNELTFEEEWCALDLQAALKDWGIASTIFQAGKQYKVRLPELHAKTTDGQPLLQPEGETAPPETTPAEVPSAAKGKAVREASKPAENIPNFIPQASQSSQATLTPKEKRRRFADLAKQDSIETGRELEEEQTPLELSFTPAKKAGKKRKKP